MSKNLRIILPKPFFVLAPIEDVIDVVSRHAVKKAGALDAFSTELINSDSYCHPEGKDSVRGRLVFTEDEQPMVVHIWGDKPEFFREMSIGVAEVGFQGLDINMGCPASNVAEHGKGSGPVLRPEVAAELIDAVKAGGLPVSVKARTGFTEMTEMEAWITHLLKQNIASLSIHLRIRKEMSKADTHWEVIPQITATRDHVAPQTIITVDGDILGRQKGLELAEQYGADDITIGRGISKNPHAFEKEPETHTPQELLGLLRLQLDLQDRYAELVPRSTVGLHRLLKIHAKGFSGVSDLGVQLMNTKSADKVHQLLATSETGYGVLD